MNLTATEVVKAFEEKLSTKTSWGRNEVISVLKDVFLEEGKIKVTTAKNPTGRVEIPMTPEDFESWLKDQNWTDAIKDNHRGYFLSSNSMTMVIEAGSIWYE